MKILTRDEFKQLLNEHPTKKFLFLEWVPNTNISDFHISSGDPKYPGFGATTFEASIDDDIIFEYDWSIDEYSDDDLFAVLSDEDILNFINIFRECLDEKGDE